MLFMTQSTTPYTICTTCELPAVVGRSTNKNSVTNKVTAPQDAHGKLVLQVYLGSNTLEVQCYKYVKSLFVGFSENATYPQDSDFVLQIYLK